MSRITMDQQLIAPCGMNCTLCIAYQRDKKKCQGCNGSDINKPVHCIRCRIKNCEGIIQSSSQRCCECSKFPCRRLRELDKRYQSNYAMSMIENLEKIRRTGMECFLKDEIEKWTCKTCGGIVCVHKGHCLNCGSTSKS